MPLDGHSYLVSQGWTGSGTGLRQGAIARPLAIPQKKTLAGLGKDRDEAFPFWDHLFSAASKSIQIKISGDDSDDSDSEPNANVSLKRTSTGILSNRRPITGALADDSGATTPDVDETQPQLSLLAAAKRAAAKRMLYSRFFRGPILGPDSAFPPEPAAIPVPTPDVAEEKPQKKKRKLLDVEEEARQERKRLKKEKKELKEKERAEKSREKSRGKEKVRESVDAVASTSAPEDKEKKRKRKREVEGDVDAVTSNPDPELKEKKRKRKREAEEDEVEVKSESKRKSKQKSKKDSKPDKEKREKEKRGSEETSQESGEERKRKQKRPIE
ncbi:hypothetical protein C8R45DRAFT_1208278 [Mycena sanguinolenta]|nr:hypothetical protein C8R45DRAFT_1208278 [Mycena sanguinolenta]